MSNKIKLRINPKIKGNHIFASRKYTRNQISLKIDENPLLITPLQIDLSIMMFQKDAQYFVDLIKQNKDRAAEIQINFK
jgi:hypothetical protein